MTLNLQKAQFTVVGEEPAPKPPAPPPLNQEAARATQLLMLAFKALGQRAVVAFFNLFTVATVGSAWVLWYRTLPEPTPNQLIGLSVYAAFVLAVEVIRRRPQ